MTRLPAFDTDQHYSAEWAGTGPQVCRCCGKVYLHLTLDDGRPLRLRLPAQTARDVAATLAAALGVATPSPSHCATCGGQSASSSDAGPSNGSLVQGGAA